MSNLNKLNNIWKSLNEETNVPRETSEKDEKSVEKEDVSIEVVAIATNETKKSGSLYGKAPEFVLFKDTNSKTPTPVSRDQGAKEAVKDFKVTNIAMEVTEPVSREMGVQDAVKDFKVTNTPMDTVEEVPREMGVQEAPLDYLKQYKTNIGKVLESIKESVKI